MLKVWLLKPSMWRKPCGVPRSENRMVTWCSDSGESDQKSHIMVGDFRLVCGSLLGERSASFLNLVERLELSKITGKRPLPRRAGDGMASGETAIAVSSTTPQLP